MSNYLKVSTKSIKTDAENIEALKDTIPTFIKELETAMQQLSCCWEGPTWANYQGTVALYIEMLTDIYDYMSRYTANMQTASKNYTRTEQDICADIRNVFTLF